MSLGLFSYPPQAAFQKVLPKNKIYEHARPSRSVRDRFVAEVSQVVWKYKLAPETINLPARSGVPEIQVFGISLKSPELSEPVLRCIDKAISFPILFELTHGDRIKVVAAWKRPSESDSVRWVVDSYFATDWMSADTLRPAMPVALDLARLYEQLLEPLIRWPRRPAESIQDLVGRAQQIQAAEREHTRLEQRLRREPQFNRKVELNAQIRTIQQQLAALRG
jgi:hypothetical protein